MLTTCSGSWTSESGAQLFGAVPPRREGREGCRRPVQAVGHLSRAPSYSGQHVGRNSEAYCAACQSPYARLSEAAPPGPVFGVNTVSGPSVKDGTRPIHRPTDEAVFHWIVDDRSGPCAPRRRPQRFDRYARARPSPAQRRAHEGIRLPGGVRAAVADDSCSRANLNTSRSAASLVRP